MKFGALIFIRPAEYGCVLYMKITRAGRQKYTLADREDAQRFADEHQLVVVHSPDVGAA